MVAIGLVLVSICGIYARRRLTSALVAVGVRPRVVRIVRWAFAWLLWGFPLTMVVSIFVSRWLEWETMPRFDGAVTSWLFAVPFIWMVLVIVQSTPWLLASELVAVIVKRRKSAAAAARLRTLVALVVMGGFALYMPVRVLAERGDLRVRTHQLGAASSTVPPMKIAFLADTQQDVHTGSQRVREVYELVNASAPDLVLSGGDWINSGPDHIGAAADAAAMLKSRLGTFSVRGDHEHFAYTDRDRSVGEVERALGERGISMLANDVRWFEHHGKRVAVVFLNYNYLQRTDAATITTLVASIAKADYRIVVTHQLDRQLADLLQDQVDLVLAGHTHGGQINPVLGLVHVPLARLETRFIDGRYALGTRTTVIVTAGIGFSLVPLRYASPGSLELLELRL